jgi:glutamate synthase (NADPH) small chain
MGKPTGFMESKREQPSTRAVEERTKDWKEIYLEFPEEKRREQASRCMDCGVPFCNSGCPLGNLIPEWNDLVYKGQWKEALARLLKTNNFPEFTGRICPAPCEGSCVLGINEPPVSIKLTEVGIIDRAFAEGWITPHVPKKRTGKKIAVIGSGPAGLATADQLNKAGHLVTVFERSKRVGGLLTFGIPDFKLDKSVVDRRVRLMTQEGIEFKTSVNVGFDLSMEEIQFKFDAVVMTCGSTQPRDLSVPGRDLNGVHFAMDYLSPQNLKNHGDLEKERYIDAKDKNVIIIGGGDTGADCLGTAHRQGAKSIKQFEIVPMPPTERTETNPWPQWPMILRTSSAHEEGGERVFCINTTEFVGDDNGNLKFLKACEVGWAKDDQGRNVPKNIPGTEKEFSAELVFLAMGFVHPEHQGPMEQVGCEKDARGNVVTDDNYMTNVQGVFSAGDMRRGQSLVVWAIDEGRKAARAVDLHLMGASDLPD